MKKKCDLFLTRVENGPGGRPPPLKNVPLPIANGPAKWLYQIQSLSRPTAPPLSPTKSPLPLSKFPRAPFVPYIRGVMAPSWFRKQKKSNLARGAPRSTQEDPGATWNTKKEAGGPYRHPGGSRRSSEDQGSARRTPQDPRGLIKEQSFRSKKIPNNTMKGP